MHGAIWIPTVLRVCLWAVAATAAQVGCSLVCSRQAVEHEATTLPSASAMKQPFSDNVMPCFAFASLVVGKIKQPFQHNMNMFWLTVLRDKVRADG